jgi:hypothetical protein
MSELEPKSGLRRSNGNLRPAPPWQPGQSGNPGGRPKGWAEFMQAMRERSPKAIKVMDAALARGERWAVELCLAYAWGKPREYVALNTNADEEQRAEERRLRMKIDALPLSERRMMILSLRKIGCTLPGEPEPAALNTGATAAEAFVVAKRL